MSVNVGGLAALVPGTCQAPEVRAGRDTRINLDLRAGGESTSTPTLPPRGGGGEA